MFERYVALGDSSTEGLEDRIAPGRYRGWADRLAEHVAVARRAAMPDGPPLRYANLAVRGRKTRQVREEQLAPALAMRPDLATVFCGTNDVIRSGFRLDPVLADIRAMQEALRAQGATVLTITMPDLSDIVPIARRVAPRLAAFNAGVREISRETGTIVVDMARYAFVTDLRFWDADRLHANAEGHRRIAAALAEALRLPGSSAAWAEPLPPAPPEPALVRRWRELAWGVGFFVPWMLRRLTGRSSGDGVTAKRPELTDFAT